MSRNYDDMHFTEQDRTQLKVNKTRIIQWIMENIVPILNEDSHIRIDFGGKYSSPRTFSVTDNYHLTVYGKENNFTSGGGEKTRGYIGFGQKFGGISYSLEATNSPYDIYPIIDNWTMIKKSLMERLDQMYEEKEAIYKFKV